jgi:hypothetical protein
MDENMTMLGKLLLLVGGLVHLIPALYTFLAQFQVAGWPIVQVIVGLLSVIIALMWLMEKK